MQVFIKGFLFDDVRNTTSGSEVKIQTVELDSKCRPPQTVQYNGNRYSLLHWHMDKAKYVKDNCDPFCTFCALRESEAGSVCPKNPIGVHDFDDIPF